MKKLLLRLFTEQIWIAHKECKTECMWENPDCVHGCHNGSPKLIPSTTAFILFILIISGFGITSLVNSNYAMALIDAIILTFGVFKYFNYHRE